MISLELSTGIPLLYIFKEGKFMKRGSPVGPTEAGVYAYTKVMNNLSLLYLFKFLCFNGSECFFVFAEIGSIQTEARGG